MKHITFSFTAKFDTRFLKFNFKPKLITIQFMAETSKGDHFELHARSSSQGHFEYPLNNLAKIPSVSGEECVLHINETAYRGRLLIVISPHSSGLSMVTLSLHGQSFHKPSDYYIATKSGTLSSVVGAIPDRTKYPQGCFEIVKAGVLDKCSGYVRQDHEAFLSLLETQFKDARSTEDRLSVFRAYLMFFDTRSKLYMHYGTLLKTLSLHDKKVRQLLYTPLENKTI